MFDSMTPKRESSKLLCLASRRQAQTGLFNPIRVKGLIATWMDPM